MKALTVTVLGATVALLALTAATEGLRCIRDNTDGQPGCKKDEEMKQGAWRHNFDPTHYWECERLGEPGHLRSCDNQAFHPTLHECVDWDDWEWEPVCAPLSRPDQ